jgi:hypothetical protein
MLDAIESSVIEGSLLGAARIVSQMTVSEDCLGGLSCIIDIPSEEADGARHQTAAGTSFTISGLEMARFRSVFRQPEQQKFLRGSL